MLIDWFTVLAQVVNFIILAWLLKHFLYRPILDAIDAREKKIAAALADANKKQTEAQTERDQYQQKNKEFDQQRAAVLAKAADEAKTERQKMLDEARKAADELSAKRQESLRNEQKSLAEALSLRARDEVLAIARKALADLAGATLEERMVDVFLQKWATLDDKAMDGFKSAFKASSATVFVRAAFTLAPGQRAAIEAAIKGTLGVAAQVRFEVAPELVGGIEANVNGQKVAWSVADYLNSLEKSIDEVLKAQATPEAKVKPTPEKNANEHAA
jgi:F-type H+-transporting ATPase subunit b